MAANHTWNPFTDLNTSPNAPGLIRDVLLPTIQGRLEVQAYATTAALPAAGDFTGQFAYTSDYGVFWRWSGTAWRVAGVPEFANATARDAAITSPTQGDRCLTLDTMTLWERGTAAWKRLSSDGMRTVTEATLAADYPVTTTGAVIMTASLDVPDTAAIYEVTVDLDVSVVSATGATLTISHSAGGVSQPGSVLLVTNTSFNGARLHQSHTWRVTGLTAGTGKAFNINASASAASRFSLVPYSDTHMIIKQVA